MTAEPSGGDLAARARSLALGGAGLALALPLWAWWAVWKGGHEPAVFLPAIAYLAVAATLLHLWAPRRRLRNAPAAALAALAALAAWTVLSLVWADDRGAAEIAAGRQVLLLASFALPVLWPPTRAALACVLGGFAVAALAGGISGLAEALDDVDALLDGRLVGPTGYANGSAALFAMGALPAIVIASRREVDVAVRAGGLVVAGVLGGMFVLTQSRGGVGALAIALLVAVAVVPGRLRLAIAIAIAAAGVLAILEPLLEVRRVAVDGGDTATALRDAARALGLLGAALVPLGLLYAIADRRLELAPGAIRAASRGARVALAALAVVGAAFLVASAPAVVDWAGDRLDDFKTPDYSRLESEDTRFTGDLGSNRYDYWRVSVEIFADRPATGSGAGNFIAPYLALRDSDISTLYAHSVWLGTLAELGAPGTLALLLFAAALGLALAGSLRRAGREGWLVAAASLPLVYAAVHASADWVGTFPIVVAPAVALAGAAAALDGSGGAMTRRGWRSASTWLAITLAAAAVAALPLWVAARFADRGAATWTERPSGALRDLERAAELDPLAPAPHVRRGVVAVGLGRPDVARQAFEAALDRDRAAWYPYFQLGLLAAERGEPAVARRKLRAALRLNPEDPLIRRALRLVEAGRTYDPLRAQQIVLGRSIDG
jgi:tetratricopeptide (TPR) repeat protein